jgi:hypothetical protein
VRFSEKTNQLIWGAGTSALVDGALLRLEYAQSKTSPNFEGVTLDETLRVVTVSVAWMF